MRNWVFSELTLYTFEEVSEYLIGLTGGGTYPPFDKTGIEELFVLLPLIVDGKNPYGLSFLVQGEYNVELSSLALTCLNKISLRYKDHYCVSLKKEEEKDKEFKSFFIKLANVLDHTYLRYSTLLNNYDTQKANLLNGLQRTRSGTRNVSQNGEHEENSSNLNLFNDTPQTTDVVATIEGTQYVSELNKGTANTTGSNSTTGEDEFSETETHDTMTPIEKLKELENKFANVWKNWLNEFEDLFVEGVNY
ncbi:hypothetical protein IKD48_01125 [bacterium]|nr:hypothetical protein [bacterium]